MESHIKLNFAFLASHGKDSHACETIVASEFLWLSLRTAAEGFWPGYNLGSLESLS